MIYAAAPVPASGWALVRGQRADALHAMLRVPIAVKQAAFSTIAHLRAGFRSAVSRGLRTPLAQIRRFAELLRECALRGEAESDHALGILEKEAGGSRSSSTMS